MTIQIDIDDATLAEVDAALKILNEDRDDVFQKAFVDLARRKKREAAVAGQYADAYSKKVGDDEFNIEEEQLIEAWDEL